MNINDLISKLGVGGTYFRMDTMYTADGVRNGFDYVTCTYVPKSTLHIVELHRPHSESYIKFYVSDLEWLNNYNLKTKECARCNGTIAWDESDEEYEHIFDTRDGDVCRDCFEEYRTCEKCGEVFNRDDDGPIYSDSLECWYCCEDCAHESNVYACERCGEWHNYEDMSEVVEIDGPDPVLWCFHCVDNHTFQCNHCGTVYDCHRNYEYEVDGEYWCEDCHDNDSDECEVCGGRFSEADMFYTDDDEHLCQACYDMRVTYHLTPGVRASFGKSGKCYKADGTQRIYRYHGYPCDEWKQQLLEHKDYPSDLFLGVELELCRGGEDDVKASIIRHAIEQTDEHEVEVSHHIWAAHDGSLDRGVELISQPATAPFHLNLDGKGYDWETGMKTAVDLNYVSHDGGLCGLHFHVNRSFFRVADPEDTCAVILSNNSEWLKLFSRRKNYRYCSFSRAEVTSFDEKEFKYNGSPDEAKAYRKINDVKDCMRGHGSAMNYCNAWTIEFRFIRGTLKYNTFVAAMQMVVMFCEFANNNIKECTKVSLESFVDLARIRGYNEFLKYLDERDIKVDRFPNNSIISEVDTVVVDDVAVTSNEA